MNARERLEELQRAVDGRNDMVWASYQYGCRKCGHIEWIYLGVGVEVGINEKPLKNEKGEGIWIPSPFGGPRCEKCQGETTHIRWKEDRRFLPIDAPAGVRYFKVPNKIEEIHIRSYDSSAFCGDIVRAPIASAPPPGIIPFTDRFPRTPRAG